MKHEALTASQLADALECFWNAALGAQRNDGTTVQSMVEGIAAVAGRLRTVSNSQPGATAILQAELTAMEARAIAAEQALRDTRIQAMRDVYDHAQESGGFAVPSRMTDDADSQLSYTLDAISDFIAGEKARAEVQK